MHLILACLMFTAVTFARPEEKYTTKYDNIELDEILNNERLYQKYFQCLIGKGLCTPDGKDLKDAIPEALISDCSKCGEKQKHGFEKVLRFLIEKKKADYDVLEKVYDKEGIYRKKYQAELKRRGIILD